MAMEYTATQQMAFAAGKGHIENGRKKMGEIFPLDKKEDRLLLLSQEGAMLLCKLRGPEGHGQLRFEATSIVTGKELREVTISDSATLCPINPGEKYSVAVYDDAIKPCLLLERQHIQTTKSIGEEGGQVKVGLCILDFPPEAVRNNTQVGVAPCGKDTKELPDDFWNIMPPMDLLSTQEHFSKQVTCKFHFPYLTMDKQIELALLCLENQQWKKVCTAQLTENKTAECKISHFTPYVLGIFVKPFVKHVSYGISRRLPISMKMKNIIFQSEDGNFVGVTCLDCESFTGEWYGDLIDRYKKSELVIDSFDMAIDSTATFHLKIIEPEQRIDDWQVTFDKKFAETYVHKRTMRLSNDNGLLDHKSHLELSFERDYAGNLDTRETVNMKNPFHSSRHGDDHRTIVVYNNPGVVVNTAANLHVNQQFD